jgi:DNA-binding PadR family transcriptional regulator
MAVTSEPVAVSGRGELILISLAGKDRHGYALMQDIEQFAGVKLGPGTLYGALNTLEDQGMVEPLASDDRRRPYGITELGREVLASQLSDSQRVARLGLRRLSAT